MIGLLQTALAVDWYVATNGTGLGTNGWANANTLNNCIVYLNGARDSASTNSFGCTFVNSCTAPSNTGWAVGNIADNPMFISNGSGSGLTHVPGNYRLTTRSPCLNAGTNGSWTTTYPYDLVNKPCVKYGAVDMGAYEHIRAGTVYGIR